jgi:hypothetical protein
VRPSDIDAAGWLAREVRCGRLHAQLDPVAVARIARIVLAARQPAGFNSTAAAEAVKAAQC